MIILKIIVFVAAWFLLGYIGACIIRANNPKNLNELKTSQNRKESIGYVHVSSYMKHTLWLGPIGLIEVLYRMSRSNEFKLKFQFW